MSSACTHLRMTWLAELIAGASCWKSMYFVASVPPALLFCLVALPSQGSLHPYPSQSPGNPWCRGRGGLRCVSWGLVGGAWGVPSSTCWSKSCVGPGSVAVVFERLCQENTQVVWPGLFHRDVNAPFSQRESLRGRTKWLKAVLSLSPPRVLPFKTSASTALACPRPEP